MRSICGFIFSVLSVIAFTCKAQDQSQPASDTTQPRPKPPREPKDFRPTGIRLGTDLISLIKTNTQKNFSGWELNGDVDFANYFAVLDIGSWSRDFVMPNGEYQNSGTYFRIGADVNFLRKDPDHNMFFLGVRYGFSSFHESLTYHETLPLYGYVPHTVSNPSVTGNWAELTTGLRVKVWKQFWVGYTARMKFAATTKGQTPDMSPYDMPGYGPVQQAPWWGFNYQVFWRFPIRKEKVVAKP